MPLVCITILMIVRNFYNALMVKRIYKIVVPVLASIVYVYFVIISTKLNVVRTARGPRRKRQLLLLRVVVSWFFYLLIGFFYLKFYALNDYALLYILLDSYSHHFNLLKNIKTCARKLDIHK